MGIFDALTTAVAGLQAQSFALQNISGNIANSQTTGYKETDTSFEDMVSAAAVGNRQTSGGVIANSVATNTVQGTIQSTSVSTDMAINGNGWFVVAQPTGEVDNQPEFSGVNDYTRAGDFQLNSSGYLVNGAGYYLMGIPIDAATGNPVGSSPQVLQFDNDFVPAQATTAIQYQANLPSAPSSGMLVPTDFEANPLAGAPPRQLSPAAARRLQPDAIATGTGTVGNLSNGTTLASLGINAGDTITINDGTNTTNYVRAGRPAGADSWRSDHRHQSAACRRRPRRHQQWWRRRQSGSHRHDRHRLDHGHRDGTDAADLGFGAGANSFEPTNLLTQGAVAQGDTMTITVGGGPHDHHVRHRAAPVRSQRSPNCRPRSGISAA